MFVATASEAISRSGDERDAPTSPSSPLLDLTSISLLQT